MALVVVTVMVAAAALVTVLVVVAAAAALLIVAVEQRPVEAGGGAGALLLVEQGERLGAHARAADLAEHVKEGEGGLRARQRDVEVLGARERERDVLAQVLGETCEEIIRDAETLQEKIGGNLYIKVPVSIEGYKAMPILKKMGYKVTATAIFTPGQALLAANSNVDFTAPYINRIDNISGMGVSVVQMITTLFKMHKLPTQVLAASFKNIQQVNEVSLAGCHAITISPDLMWKLAEHPLTDMSIELFTKDWCSVYGEGKCIYNL